MSNESKEYKSFIPYELVHIISLTSVQLFEQSYLTIRGKYLDLEKKDSNGFFYDKLVDETSGGKLTILERKTNNFEELNVYLTFAVTVLKDEMPPLVDFKNEDRFAILQSKNSKLRRNIDDLLNKILSENNKPRIALVSGKDVETTADVYNSMGNYQNYFSIKDFAVSLTDKNQIIQTLKQLDEERNFDLIALYRGGGSMDTFEDVNIAQTILQFHTPFVTALGHSNNQPLVHLVADQGFITPTAMGTYFKNLVEKFLERDKLKLEINELKQQLKKAKEDQSQELNSKDVLTINLQENLTSTISINKDLQNQLKSLTYQNNALLKESETIKHTKNEFQNLEESNNYKPLIIISSVLSLLIGIGLCAGLIFGYQYLFSAQSSTENSTQPKTAAKELPANAANEASNINNCQHAK
jgi:hypothetical protein